MAHGNASDMLFLVLLAVAVQWWGFPATLFEDIGPFKAQFSKQSADMDACIKFGGGLLLMLGLALSSVKWNPINGKMAGFGGFIASGYTAYDTFQADSGAFVPRLFYVYALLVFLAALHIFAFPSNPLTPKGPNTKNNHGNASDMIAFSLIGTALLCFFYPDHLFQSVGPMKAQFSAKSADLSTIIKFIGGLLLIIALIFSGVKWNPLNGKGTGLGGFIVSGYTAYASFKADSDTFVLRPFYVYAGLLFLGSLHIFAFPSNPKPEKASDKKA